MQSPGPRRPPAPTCEECSDDDTQDSRSKNRSNSIRFDPTCVAEKKNHDGSDSGYSSKAGTSENVSTVPMKKGGNLKVDTNPIERERQPYAHPPPQIGASRSPTKPKSARSEKSSEQPPPFRHTPLGICMLCDRYGYHIDPEKEFMRPATTVPTQKQKVANSQMPMVKAKDDGDARPPTSRRSSSKRANRPTSMYASFGAYDFASPSLDMDHTIPPPDMWQMYPHQMHQAPQYQYTYPPPTPVSATYAPQPGFFDMSPLTYALPSESYYDSLPPNGYIEYASQHNLSQQEGEWQRSSSRDGRPRSATHKSKKAGDPEKLALDRASMPPPPRPEPVRPIIRKSPTDHPMMIYQRHSVFEDDDEQPAAQNIVARTRNSSQSRPPSSYKQPVAGETQARPRARKSSSYSTPSGTVQVATSQSRDMARRKTDPLHKRPSDSDDHMARVHERNEAAVEAYVARSRNSKDSDFEDHVLRVNRNAMNSSLTTEALKKWEQRVTGGVSDAESIRSKHSSGKDSATGRTRAGTTLSTATHINLEMGGFSFPIHPEFEEVSITMGGGKKLQITQVNEDDRSQRGTRQIEKAPSEYSQSSRRSQTSGSQHSTLKSRDNPLAKAREKGDGRLSKRSSRAPSAHRRDTNTGSFDYSLLDETYYLGA